MSELSAANAEIERLKKEVKLQWEKGYREGRHIGAYGAHIDIFSRFNKDQRMHISMFLAHGWTVEIVTIRAPVGKTETYTAELSAEEGTAKVKQMYADIVEYDAKRLAKIDPNHPGWK